MRIPATGPQRVSVKENVLKNAGTTRQVLSEVTKTAVNRKVCVR